MSHAPVLAGLSASKPLLFRCLLWSDHATPQPGLNENQWVDNLQITTTLGTVTPGAEFTSITRNAAGQMVIQWTGGGTLQSTDSLSAPNWTAVTGASSPYTVAPGATGSRFYRIQQ